MTIKDLPETTRLIQLAEEASELSQAALKLVRSLEGMTPVSEAQARAHLTEEAADVLVCINALDIDSRMLRQISKRKTARWGERINDPEARRKFMEAGYDEATE